MNAELAKSLITALWVAGTAIVAAVVWLTALVFRAGKKFGAADEKLARLEKAGEKIEKASEKLERIPAIEVKVDMLANVQSRMSSLFPPMQEKVTALWEKVFSLQNWRKSRPNIGNGNGE